MSDVPKQWLRVYVAHIRSIPEYAFEGLDESGQPAASVHKRRRVQFRAGRALARVAIERSVGVSRNQQRFQLTQSGKPVCVGGPPISLSHSGEWVVCAVAPTGDIGIDLQFPAQHLNVDAIAKNYFHGKERQWVLDGGRERFFMLWTLKEAYLKALGMGISGGLERGCGRRPWGIRPWWPSPQGSCWRGRSCSVCWPPGRCAGPTSWSDQRCGPSPWADGHRLR